MLMKVGTQDAAPPANTNIYRIAGPAVLGIKPRYRGSKTRWKVVSKRSSTSEGTAADPLAPSTRLSRLSRFVYDALVSD